MTTIREQVQVLNSDASFAWVRPVDKVGCHRCGVTAGACTPQSSRRGFFSARKTLAFKVRLKPGMRVHEGDALVVVMDSTSVFIATVVGYLMPLLCMLVGAFLLRSGGDLAVLCGLLAGFLVSFLVQRWLFESFLNVARFEVMAETVQESSPP